jgi:hypothetical protein
MISGLLFPLGRAAPDVVDSGLVGAHPHDDDAVEGRIGLPVSAAVQPVAGDQPRTEAAAATAQ